MAKPSKIEPSTTLSPETSAAVTSAVTSAVLAGVPVAAVVAAPTGVVGVGAVKAGNVVMLASGERRVDYIKRRFAEGATRGVIAKELGVAYQIVFAATKAKKDPAAAASTAAQGAAILATAGADAAATDAATDAAQGAAFTADALTGAAFAAI